MKAILVTPKFGGRQYIIVSMDFPKPVNTSEYSLIELQLTRI